MIHSDHWPLNKHTKAPLTCSTKCQKLIYNEAHAQVNTTCCFKDLTYATWPHNQVLHPMRWNDHVHVHGHQYFCLCKMLCEYICRIMYMVSLPVLFHEKSYLSKTITLSISVFCFSFDVIYWLSIIGFWGQNDDWTCFVSLTKYYLSGGEKLLWLCHIVRFECGFFDIHEGHPQSDHSTSYTWLGFKPHLPLHCQLDDGDPKIQCTQ